MFAPRLSETENSLTVSPSVGLRAASMAAFLFFLCLTGIVLAAPFLLISGGPEIGNLAGCIPLALLVFLPTRLFWEGCQTSALTFHFSEGRYELRRGFRNFAHTTRGCFFQIAHLTVWSKQENSVDISYTTSLTWNIKRRPVTLHTSYNNAEEAHVWAAALAQKLRVPLNNRIGK